MQLFFKKETLFVENIYKSRQKSTKLITFASQRLLNVDINKV